jgi:hypothetical protein
MLMVGGVPLVAGGVGSGQIDENWLFYIFVLILGLLICALLWRRGKYKIVYGGERVLEGLLLG